MTTGTFGLVLGLYTFFMIPPIPSFVCKLHVEIPLWLRFSSKLVTSIIIGLVCYLIASVFVLSTSFSPLCLLLVLAFSNWVHPKFGIMIHNWISVFKFRFMDIILSSSFTASIFGSSGIGINVETKVPLCLFLFLQPKNKYNHVLLAYNEAVLKRHTGERLELVSIYM
ncbi:hypothetical protein [Vibrio harveyi]|uniref:hypothetical protein n=1 Tax=Vibrio harveyi TaxID=669 RepID=UPI0024815370|nr:hypothetical protein [Vibrio harveyi]